MDDLIFMLLSTALSMEQDIPDYDMDEEDENWVKKQAQVFDLTPFKFEIMMDRLEKGSGQKVRGTVCHR